MIHTPSPIQIVFRLMHNILIYVGNMPLYAYTLYTQMCILYLKPLSQTANLNAKFRFFAEILNTTYRLKNII